MQHTYYVVSESSELQHHGIKGMHWGIRRTMEELGHYIKKRKKRKQLEKARQVRAQKKKESEEAAKRPKKLSEMTDEELAAKLKRSQTEEAYLRSQSNVRNLTPATPPKHPMLSKLTNEVIAPAATSAGKELLEKSLKKYGAKMLGVDEKSVKSLHDRLKEEQDIAVYRANIAKQQYDLKNAKNAYKAEKYKYKKEIATNKLDMKKTQLALKDAKDNYLNDKGSAYVKRVADDLANMEKIKNFEANIKSDPELEKEIQRMINAYHY